MGPDRASHQTLGVACYFYWRISDLGAVEGEAEQKRTISGKLNIPRNESGNERRNEEEIFRDAEKD